MPTSRLGATNSGIGSCTPEIPKRRQHAAEGNRGEDRHRGGHDHDRRQAKQRFIDVAGGEFFFENEFQPIGQRLTQAEHFDVRQRNADAVGPAAILNPRRHPALQQHQIRRRRQQPADEQGDFDQCDNGFRTHMNHR